jgi:hypothetical protein
MNIAIGKSGIRLAAVASLWDSVAESFSSHEIRVELALDDNNSKKYFEQLEIDKAEIEKETGEKLNWYNPPEKRMCRIYVRKSTNLEDKNKWPEQHDWLLKNLRIFYDVFANRVKRL